MQASNRSVSAGKPISALVLVGLVTICGEKNGRAGGDCLLLR